MAQIKRLQHSFERHLTSNINLCKKRHNELVKYVAFASKSLGNLGGLEYGIKSIPIFPKVAKKKLDTTIFAQIVTFFKKALDI